MSRLLAAAIIVALATPACQQEAEVDPSKAKPEVPKVHLPASPEMVEPRVPERYTDGSFTVAGLIKNQSKHLNNDIRITGFISKIYKCGAEAACELPDHAVLVDDLQRPMKRLVVLGGADTIFGELKESQSVKLKGYYGQSDPQGMFVRMEGLLLLERNPALVEEEAATTGD